MDRKNPSPAVKRNRLVFIALFAALICVSTFVTIPFIPGIPIVLKNMIAVLSGVVLGSYYGALAVLVYIVAGILGLPVFANAGGLASFLSPTGGYLAGYAVGALVAGLIISPPHPRDKKITAPYVIKIVVALLAGFMMIDLLGGLGLIRLNMMTDAPKANLAVFLGGIVPFIPADAIKLVIAIPLSLSLRPLVAQYLHQDDE